MFVQFTKNTATIVNEITQWNAEVVMETEESSGYVEYTTSMVDSYFKYGHFTALSNPLRLSLPVVLCNLILQVLRLSEIKYTLLRTW